MRKPRAFRLFRRYEPGVSDPILILFWMPSHMFTWFCLYSLQYIVFLVKIDDDMKRIGFCWRNIMMKPYKSYKRLNLSHFFGRKSPNTIFGKHHLLLMTSKYRTTLRWNNLLKHNDINWLRIAGSSVFFVSFETSRFKAKNMIYIYIIYTWQFFVTFLGWLSDPSEGCWGPQTGGSKGHGLNHLV